MPWHDVPRLVGTHEEVIFVGDNVRVIQTSAHGRHGCSTQFLQRTGPTWRVLALSGSEEPPLASRSPAPVLKQPVEPEPSVASDFPRLARKTREINCLGLGWPGLPTTLH